MTDAPRSERRKSALLLASALLTSALCLEGGSWLVLRSRATPHHESIDLDRRALRLFLPADDGLPFAVKPGFTQHFAQAEFDTLVRTNNRGFRDDTDYHGEPVDIGLLGDSFFFGHGVSNGELISDRLRPFFPGKRIFSYAYPNGGFPLDYYLFLTRHPELVPKIAVMGLFTLNDFTIDPLERELVFDANGTVTSAASKAKEVRPEGFIVRREPVRQVAAGLQFLHRFHFGRVLAILYGRLVSGTYRSQAPPKGDAPPLYRGKFDARNRMVLEHIRKTRDYLAQRGSRLVVFLIPEALHVRDTPQCEFREDVCRDLRRGRYLQRAIGEWLAERNIELVDPTAELERRSAAGERLYYELDAHWTPAGHRAAAEILARYLGKDALVGRSVTAVER